MSDNLLDVVRYVGDNNVIVAKSKIVDFNRKSQVIVNESQEALFYKDGQALDLFPSGRHSLNSENLPFFKRLFSGLFGGKNPLPCEVYFINKVNVLDILWGTDSPISLEDPKYNILIKVRSNGQMGIRVVDSRKFVVKVVGQLDTFDVDDVKRTIKGALLPSVKEVIAKAIALQGYSILEIATRLSNISEEITKMINNYISDLGIEVVHFYVNSITAPDEDLAKLKKVKEKYLEAMTDIDIEAIREIKIGEAKARARQAQGYTYQEERQFDVLEGAAKNEGAGNTMSATMGLGMGLGVGKTISNQVTEIVENSANEDQKQCPGCKTINKKTAKFCIECGFKFPPASRFCPECGTKVDGTSKFCPECGTKIE